jgi:hypothetical protein
MNGEPGKVKRVQVFVVCVCAARLFITPVVPRTSREIPQLAEITKFHPCTGLTFYACQMRVVS